MKEALLKYARYNQWANDKTVQLLTMSTPELINKEMTSSYPTIKHTVLHVADAELIWYSRLTQGSFPELPSKTGKQIDCLKQADALLIDFITSKDNAFFTQSTLYKNMKGDDFTNNNSAILMHVFNHGTFHRGQIVSMLRMAGYTGPIESTDYISYERI